MQNEKIGIVLELATIIGTEVPELSNPIPPIPTKIPLHPLHSLGVTVGGSNSWLLGFMGNRTRKQLCCF
jgi:hypothetical protein